MDKQKDKTKKSSVKTSVRSLINSPQNKVVKEKSEIRSELITLADKLFGNNIKKRDSDEDGNVICPCCKLVFNLEDTYLDSKGILQKIIQPLHFIDRDVYSLRFDEKQVFAGCCFCNKRQHDSPEGIEFHNYKQFLIDKYGKDYVAKILLEKRLINKISHSMIQEVIDKYRPIKI